MVISHHIISVHANERVATLRREAAAGAARPTGGRRPTSRSNATRRRRARAFILGLRGASQ
jgi:hypothetical protein